MKFEIKARSPNESISNKHCPENIINVTIINGSKHKENVKPSESSKEVQKTTETQSQLTSEANSAASTRRRKLLSKRLLLLPKHVKTRRTNIVHKKGTADGMNDGVLVRNTPADLYQKYQNDWNKFKSFIPGESIRRDIRESVRSKMQHKPEDPPKVKSIKNCLNEFACFTIRTMRVLISITGLCLFCERQD